MSKKSTNKRLPDIPNYRVLGLIGTGAYGVCYQVQHLATNKIYVSKAVNYGSMPTEEQQCLVNEVNLLSKLKHPHIVQYYGRIICPDSGVLYIIMECCQRGDLTSLIKTCKLKKLWLREDFIWKVMYQIGQALKACHSLIDKTIIVHRDIKPANIFLDQNYDLKLGDFGLAKVIKTMSADSAKSVAGTLCYMSPEMIDGIEYDEKTDVWSLGCLIYELCSLKHPFDGKDLEEVRTSISDGRGLERIPFVYSADLQRMVCWLLKVDPKMRPSIDTVLHHPNLTKKLRCDAKPFHRSNKTEQLETKASPTRNKTVLRNLEMRYTTDSFIEKLAHKTAHLSVHLNPAAISEAVYNRKLNGRLKMLHERESMLEAKERTLELKENLLRSWEDALRQKERSKMPRKRSTNTRHAAGDCLDSTTCSASPGDSNVPRTTAWLDPQKVPRPCFTRNVSKPNQTYQGNVTGKGDYATKKVLTVKNHMSNRKGSTFVINKKSIKTPLGEMYVEPLK